MVVKKFQLGRIHYVDIATLPTCLSIPVSLGMLGRLGSTLSQCRYLLRCWTKGFSTPANFRVKSLSKRSDVIKEWNSQILMNLPVTSIPRCIGSNAKALVLKHMQFPDMGASGRPPDGACIVHHWMDELLIQQDSVPDGTLLFRRGPNTPHL